MDELKRIVMDFGQEGGGLTQEEVQHMMKVVQVDEDGNVDYKQLIKKLNEL